MYPNSKEGTSCTSRKIIHLQQKNLHFLPSILRRFCIEDAKNAQNRHFNKCA